MSSDLQLAVQEILLNNEASIAMVTVLAYDYLITLPSEVNYIWVNKQVIVKQCTLSLTILQSQPWSRVTILFFLVRYVGIFSAMGIALLGTSFVPGPQKLCKHCLFASWMSIQSSKGTGLIYSSQWAYLVFLAASDLLMILRVWAMWKRSKIILGILIFCYGSEVIVQLVGIAVFDNPHTDATVIINQVLDYTTCTEVLTVLSPYLTFTLINPFLFDVLLLILALIPTIKDSMKMHKENNVWQPNRYMSLIVKEGVLYIVLNLFNNITIVTSQVHAGALPPTWVVIFGFFSIVTLYPTVPRFVLSIREMYEKESCNGIDGGFGVLTSDQCMDVSMIAFGEGQSRLDEDGHEEIQLESA